MKKIYLFTPILLLVFQSYSQEIITETGINFTSFEFTNSQEETLDNLQPKTKSFLAMGYRHNIVNEVLYLYGGISLNQYGAIGSDDSVGNYFEWDTSYLGVHFNVDLKVLNANKFTLLLRAGTAAEFMLQGTQTLNNQVFDLKGQEEFKDTTMFFRGGIIFQYQASQNIAVFTQYNYGKSSENGNSQKLKYQSSSIGVGLAFSLSDGKSKTQDTDNNTKENN